MDHVKTVGLVGGIGSGKSTVAAMLRELGAAVLEADRIGHDVLANDVEIHRAIRGRWGDAVFAADGLPNRAAIAERVFAPGGFGEAERRFLESLLHPQIRRGLETQRQSLLALQVPAIVIDAALLFEAGWDQMCDLVVFVDAPDVVRRARARHRGWSDQQFAARDAAQWPVEEKRRRAGVILSNAGSLDDLHRSIQAFWIVHIRPAGR